MSDVLVADIDLKEAGVFLLPVPFLLDPIESGLTICDIIEEINYNIFVHLIRFMELSFICDLSYLRDKFDVDDDGNESHHAQK